MFRRPQPPSGRGGRRDDDKRRSGDEDGFAQAFARRRDSPAVSAAGAVERQDALIPGAGPNQMARPFATSASLASVSS